MGNRGLVFAGIAALGLACGPRHRNPEHPDDPVNGPPSRPAPAAAAAPPPAKAEPKGPGIAYIQAQKFDLVRDAVPCPADCSRGEARTRCGFAPDIRFHDLVAKGSHQQVRAVLEKTPGVEACFADVADAKAKRLPSFRIPLDFVIGPAGGLESREDPIVEDDPQLKQMVECVGKWLDGLPFEGAGRPLPTRVRLQVEPTGICTPAE